MGGIHSHVYLPFFTFKAKRRKIWKQIKLNENIPLFLKSLIKIINAEAICEITVAIATPATPILNIATKTRFKTTFKAPEITR